MLSSPLLLALVQKLLAVCVDYAAFMTQLVASCDDLERFAEDVRAYDLSFSSKLMTLLDKIAKMGRENYNERIMNILHRLDFNGYYSKQLDKFGGTAAS